MLTVPKEFACLDNYHYKNRLRHQEKRETRPLFLEWLIGHIVCQAIWNGVLMRWFIPFHFLDFFFVFFPYPCHSLFPMFSHLLLVYFLFYTGQFRPRKKCPKIWSCVCQECEAAEMLGRHVPKRWAILSNYPHIE